MLNDYQDYANSVSAGRIKTHKEALKYFNVRYSSFTQSYPKDSALPGCTLAQNGFYFDNVARSLRCYECDFEFPDLTCDILTDILNKHINYRSKCTQAVSSLKQVVESEHDEEHEFKRAQNFTLNSSTFSNEENRLRTFENCKLIIDVKLLVQNGFYRVVKDPLKSSFQKTDDELTIIEHTSKLIPTLHHVKCAFCPYECLLFKNSLLNTLYKSPFEEHKEKYFYSCPIFQDKNKMDIGPRDHSTEFIKTDLVKNRYEWLKNLYDLDSSSDPNNNKIDSLFSEQSVVSQNFEDYTVKKFPKILDQILSIKLSTNLNQVKDVSNSVLYIPDSSSVKTSLKITSDFNKLQEALNKSNNVLSEKAHHPAYSQYETRLETFRDWPATMSQQPTDLAKAGFYYFGIKDMVKCFFCNGGLKNWDSNDDPFQDHVRWFPKCQFIRQLMGPEYVEQIKEKFKNMESGFTEANQKAAQTGSNSLISGLPPGSSLVQKYFSHAKRSVSPRTLNSRLDLNIIRKITENSSISKDSLKKAIEIKLSIQDTNNNTLNYGDDFRTPVDMAMFSYEIEQTKKRKETVLNDISDFLLYNFDCKLKALNVRDLIQLKYGLNPLHVRVIREEEPSSVRRNFCFVTLRYDDKLKLDEILDDIRRSLSKEIDELKDVFVMKTNWLEIEDKIKPLIGKQIDVTMSVEQLKLQEEEMRNRGGPILDEPVVPKSNNNEVKKNTKELADEEALQLLEENERLKNERLCVVCLSKEKNVLFLPCAHLTACLDCSYSLNNCPMCRAPIQATVRTFT